jgi:hypothetical protein
MRHVWAETESSTLSTLIHLGPRVRPSPLTTPSKTSLLMMTTKIVSCAKKAVSGLRGDLARPGARAGWTLWREGNHGASGERWTRGVDDMIVSHTIRTAGLALDADYACHLHQAQIRCAIAGTCLLHVSTSLSTSHCHC